MSHVAQKRSFSSLQDDEPVEPPQAVMSPADRKWCIQTIRSLKKHKRAIAFLDPVDPIQFNIPDYFDIVKNPMDLGTVERKLLADKYPTVDAFRSDIQLMFDNCYLYNNPGDPVCLDAKKLEEHYQKLCKKQPSMMTTPLPTPPSLATGTVATDYPSLQNNFVDTSTPPLPPPSSTTTTTTTTTSAPTNTIHSSYTPNNVPTTIKLALQKPSIPAPPLSPPIHTSSPTASDMNNVNSTETMPKDQFKRCEALVRELKKPKYKGHAWPFENPQPMDMSTYEKKLYNHEYTHEEQLAEDIRLMFRNCYTYNPPDHLVTNLGKEFEAVFEHQWAKLHQPGSQLPKKKKSSTKKQRTSASLDLDDDYVQEPSEEVPLRKPVQPTEPPVSLNHMSDKSHNNNDTNSSSNHGNSGNNGPTILRLKIKVSQPKEEPKAPEPMSISSPPKPKIPGLALSREPPTPTSSTHPPSLPNGPKLAIGTKPPSPIKEKKDKSTTLANHDKWLALAKKTSPPPSNHSLPKLPATPTTANTPTTTTHFKPKKEAPPPPPPKPKETLPDVKPFDIADIYSQIHNEKRLKEQQKREEQEKWERMEKTRLEQERIATEKRMHELREQSRKFKARKEQDKRMRLEALNAISIDISQQKMRFNEYEKEHMSRDQDWHDVYVWQRDTNDYRHMPAPGFVKRAQIKLPELRKRLLSKCVRLENSKNNYQPIDMVDDDGSDMDVE
ncbi:Bromodomain-containing protein [Blakeslea trispora]|nr:Bromodomain-containing protein [Blakeslea trispora]